MTNIPPPKKSLGQNFLQNKKALYTIAESLAITPNETVIEIGPGHGELTDILITSSAKKIIIIEKDRELAERLKLTYADQKERITVIEGDALKDLLPIIETISTPYILAGNIPYYITGYLLRIIGNANHKPLRTVFTIQKEVAERICATAPNMNRLAACVQIWGAPHIAMKLKPVDFNPPPSIDSAIIVIETKTNMLRDTHLATYYETVGIIFQQPRKKILNNLTDGFGIDKEKALIILKKAGLEGNERPENTTIEIIQHISTLIH